MGETDGYRYDVVFIVVIVQTIRVRCNNSRQKIRVGCNIIPSSSARLMGRCPGQKRDPL